ncbi:MAG: hypothetical protein JWO36_7476 [Myxococcales bacterium]|nr:hypothetical protein [Myxococcales bacterium]
MAEPVAKPSLKARLKASFVEYPRVAIYTYLVLSVLTIAGFSIAIAIGAEPSSATGVLGVLGAGWLAAKATMPIRILVVLAITPPIAAFVQRRRSNAAADDDADS